MFAFFDQPGRWFNFFSFAFAIAGVALGVWALWLAYDQIAKTLTAAQAAQRASERSLDEVRKISAVVDIERLLSLCREVHSILRSERPADASRPLHELRIGLARARSSVMGSKVFVPKEKWDATIAEVADIQRRLTNWEPSGSIGVHARRYADAIADIDQHLNELSTRVVENAIAQGE